MEDKNKKWPTTDYPEIIFEDNAVGRMKKELFDAPMSEIEKVLAEYEIPSESELGKAGCYIQNTPRKEAIEKRRKNDVVLVPIAIERFATPEGVVGKPSAGTAEKAKRPIAAILKYLTLTVEDILEAFPAGQLPDKITLRDPEELAPFLKEPWTEGWKSAYELPHIGVFHKG